MTVPQVLGGAREALEMERRLRRRIFAPLPRLTVSEWSDQRRRLSSEASAVPGRWTSFPFQRPIMDAVHDHRYRRVVAMLPSQVGGKTEMPLNLIGYHVDLDPCPLLMVEPTLEMARALSKDRIETMFRDTPALQGKLRNTARRESENTMLFKAGPGWRLTLVGSNAPAGLAMRAVRGTIFDEPDRYPPSAGTEGDVVSLGEARSTTFPNRWSYMGGTPTIKGASRIDEEYEKSTRGRWVVPCPHCGFEQALEWGGREEPFGLKWESGKPETAAYLCASCAALILETHKGAMNERGRYVHAHPERDVIGFHFTALVSPVMRWSALVREWLEAKGNNERIKAFVNTRLARVFEEPGQRLDASSLAARREAYAAEVPMGVGFVTSGTDVQPDRLELSIWGWGAGEEAWLLWHHRLWGDTSKPEVWQAHEALLTKAYRHESGQEIRIRLACVDFGYRSGAVSDYVRPRRARGVWAVRGGSQYGIPIIGNKPGKSTKHRVPVWIVGTEAAKDILFPRIAQRLGHGEVPGPRYIHIPTADRADDEYLAQWANEKAITVFRHHRPFRTYRPVSDHAAVEAIDCGVYALVGLWIAGAGVRDRLGELAARLAERAADGPATPAGPMTLATPPRAPIRTNFANRWKGR